MINMNGGGFSSGMIGNFGGIKIIINNNMVDLFRKPRCKSKRILRKWTKNPLNSRPSKNIMHDRMRGIMYCHQVIYEQLRQEFG